jgi:hypothetical protein
MSDRVMSVEVGDGAVMSVPLHEWSWKLRYQRTEPPRGTLADDRMLAASVVDSFLYLIEECTRDEAWRRIKIMRAALIQAGVRPAFHHEEAA